MLIGVQGQQLAANLSAGGTVKGDLVVEGDFKVEGAGSFAFDEIVEGTQVIEKTSTEAFLVRKDSDGGDVFVVDTQDSRVEINGFLKFSNASYIQDVGNNYLKLRIANGDYFAIHGGASDTEYFRVANDGKIGIGGSPSTKLHVKGANDNSNGQLKLESTGTDARIHFINSSGDSSTSGNADILMSATSGYEGLRFMIDNSDKMIIDENGRIGIGTTSPSTKLHLSSATNAKPAITLEQTGNNSQAGQLIFLTSGTATTNDDSGVIRFKGMNNAGTPEEIEYATIYVNHDDISDGSEDATMHFRTQSGGSLDSRMVIKSSNVGIGTSSPDGTTHIHSASAGTISAHASADDLVVENSANVGISLLSPNNAESGIYFGDTDDNDNGRFRYHHGSSPKFDFVVDGSVRAIIDTSSRISLSNNDSGANNTVFGASAGNNLASGGNSNTFFGDLAGHSNTTGDDNTYIGKSAGQANSGTGDNNTFVGSHSGYQLTGGSNNTGVGRSSLIAITTGSANVALGVGSLLDNTTGSDNVSIGNYSSAENITGGSNIAIGTNALNYNESGANNVAVGRMSMQGASGQSHSNNTAVGYQSLYAVTTGSSNTIVGVNAGDAITTGAGNVALGRNALTALNTGTSNVAIGNDSLSALTGTVVGSVAIGYEASQALTSGANQVSIGYQAGKALTTAANSTFIGYQAGLEHTGGNNIAIGDRAFYSTNAGSNSLASTKNVAIGNRAMGGIFTDAQVDGTVAIGYRALGSATMGGSNYNIAIGHESQYSNGGGQNVAIGGNTLRIADGTETGNVAIGTSVMDALNNDGSDYNTVVGNYAVRGGTGVISHNTVMGYQGMDQVGNHSSIKNTFIGYDAGGGAYAGDVTGNVGIGYQSLNGLMNGANYNVALGYVALSVVTTGDTNIGIGVSAGTDITTGSDNTIVGSSAGVLMTTTSNTVLIGKSAGAAINSADSNGTIAIGHESLTALTSGAENTAIGYNAGLDTTTSNYSTMVGYEAGANLTTGLSNTFVGRKSGYGNDSTALTGRDNTAIGNSSLLSVTNGSWNTAVGGASLGSVIGGAYNTAIGYLSGDNITTGTNNICIGMHSNASANDVTFEIVIGSGVNYANNFTGAGTETVRIGRASDFITNDFGENATWTHSSDKRIKKDIEDSALGLDFINDLRPVTFKKKAPSEYPQAFEQYNASTTERKNPDRKHYGFIAQEVKEAMDNAGHSEFPVWKENRDGMQELGETELITPLIKAVQELSAEVKQLKKQLEDK